MSSLGIGIAAYIPYWRDLLRGKTIPHPFTWLIFMIVQSIGVAGVFYGGGGWKGAVWMMLGSISCFFIFLWGLKFGQKNIQLIDILLLALAFLGIILWSVYDQPFWSIILICITDTIAYLPTFRKSYHHPEEETALAWFLFSVATVFSILALENYNFFTTTYSSLIAVLNLLLCLFLLFRRKMLQ